MGPTRRLIVIGLDLLVASLAVLAAAITVTGGFVVRAGNLRLSFGTGSRALLALTAVLVVRLALDRHLGPLGRPPAWWRRQLWLTSDQRLGIQPAGPWRRTAIAALGIGAALVVLFHDQVWHPYSVPDLGDPLFSMWRMGWVTHQLATDPARLFDTNVFYPERLTLALSDPIMLPALTSAPLVALGLHPVVAYNLLFLSGFWLSGVATYLLVERLTGSPPAAFIAGLIYATYPFRLEHYSHLELQMTQWMPLGLLALHLFVTTGRWRYAIGLGLASIAQLYSSMYFAVFFLAYLVPIGAGLLLLHRPPIGRLVAPAAVAIVLAAAMVVPLARAFVAAQPLKGDRGAEEVLYYSAVMADYVHASKHSALWASSLPRAEPERALFPGVAPLVLGGLGLVPPVTALQLVYGAGLVASVEGSRGLNGAWYSYLYRWVAPVRGIRSPARFGAIVGLTLAILAGFGVSRALGRCRSRASARLAFVGLIALVMIDAWPALTLSPLWTDPPPIYAGLKGLPRAVLAEFPILEDESSNIPYMYFSLWHWSRMVNGYSGFIPKSYAGFYRDVRNMPDRDSIAALRRRGVTHITVNCGMPYPDCPRMMAAMRTSPSLRLIADRVWQGQPVQLYEIAPSDLP